MRIASMNIDRGWIVVLAAGLLTTGCGGEEVVRQAPEVTVSQPVVRPVQPYVDFTGTTRSRYERARVSSPASSGLESGTLAGATRSVFSIALARRVGDARARLPSGNQ